MVRLSANMITTELRRLSRSTRPAHSQLACLAIELFCPLSGEGGGRRRTGGRIRKDDTGQETADISREAGATRRRLFEGLGDPPRDPECTGMSPLPLTGSESGAELDDCSGVWPDWITSVLPQFSPAVTSPHFVWRVVKLVSQSLSVVVI